MDLVDAVYATVRAFPRFELFGLSQQMRSAAISIPLNIAEGRGRYTLADQQHFLRQARGSLFELQTQIEVAVRQSFMTAEEGQQLTGRADEVGRLINGLLRSLKRPPKA